MCKINGVVDQNEQNLWCVGAWCGGVKCIKKMVRWSEMCKINGVERNVQKNGVVEQNVQNNW